MVERPTATDAGGPDIRWEASIPLVTSRFFVLDSLFAITLSIGLVYLLVFLMALVVEGEVVILPWQMGAGALVFFFLLFQLIALAVFQNRVDASFAVTSEGYEVRGGSKIRKVNRVAMVLALLSRRPGAIGSAMLATAGESSSAAWGDVRRVRYHPGARVIELRDAWLKTSRLFCPPDRYAEIEARVRAEVARAPWRSRPFNWRDAARRLAWNAVAAGGWILSVAWWPADAMGLLIGAVVAIAIAEWIDWWLGRAIALAGLVCVGITGVRAGVRAFETTTYEGLFTIYGYDYETRLLWITCAGLTVLTVTGLRRVIPRGNSAP